MAKLVLTDITAITGNETSVIAAINANNEATEVAMENTLSRDGTAPNTMEADIDLNSNKVINLAAPTNNTDAVTKLYGDTNYGGAAATDAAASAAAALVSENAAAADAVLTAADVVSTDSDATDTAADVISAAASAAASAASAATIPTIGAGDALKVIRANVGETAYELVVAGAGDMTTAVYDAAGITEQLVGLTATQTLTNKTIDADATGNVITNIGSSEIKSEMITGQSDNAVTAGDSLMYSDADDSGNLKKDTVQGILDLVTPSGITLGTPVATTSGTAIDFTGIPVGTKQITIMFTGVSTTSTSDIIVQLGDAGGIEISGYSGSNVDSTQGGGIINSVGFILNNLQAAGDTVVGTMTLTLENSSTNKWMATSSIADDASTNLSWCTGGKLLSDVLDRIRITTVTGVQTFDAGEININYVG